MQTPATSSFILSNFRHLMNGSNELIEKMGTEDLMIPKFSEEVLINLCDSAIAILKQKNSTLIHITSPSIIIGDLHGNLHDLIRIFNSIIDIFFFYLLHSTSLDKLQLSNIRRHSGRDYQMQNTTGYLTFQHEVIPLSVLFQKICRLSRP